MKVLVDTSVWSLALRRSLPHAGPEVLELIELIREVRVLMIGPIRQELLSGVKNKAQFQKLLHHIVYPWLNFQRVQIKHGPTYVGHAKHIKSQAVTDNRIEVLAAACQKCG